MAKVAAARHTASALLFALAVLALGALASGGDLVPLACAAIACLSMALMVERWGR